MLFSFQLLPACLSYFLTTSYPSRLSWVHQWNVLGVVHLLVDILGQAFLVFDKFGGDLRGQIFSHSCLYHRTG